VRSNQLLRLAGAAGATLALVLLPLRALADDRDYAPPDPGSPSGTLVAGGVISGPADIEFSVESTGVYTATIYVDGQSLVTGTVDRGSGRLLLDTTRLLDGQHTVLVIVADDTETDTVWSGTIETLNAPQGGIPTISGTTEVGQSLTATPGQWSPSPSAISYQWERCNAAGVSCAAIAGATGPVYTLVPADSGGEIAVRVLASDADGATVATSPPTGVVVDADGSAADPSGSSAASTPAAANGTGACNAAQLVAELGTRASQTVALGQTATLRGALACDGTPIGGATIDLALAPAAGSTPTDYAQIVTAADGSFSYVVPAGPSRDITVSYRAYAADAEPSAVATVALRVTPTISLHITPRSTTNGHAITFSGRVAGGYIAGAGLPVEIEYREGRNWMVYTEVLANAQTGRFRYRYTFERTTESITYTFRVAIPATGVAGYPYQPTASPPRSVHVDP